MTAATFYSSLFHQAFRVHTVGAMPAAASAAASSSAENTFSPAFSVQPTGSVGGRGPSSASSGAAVSEESPLLSASTIWDSPSYLCDDPPSNRVPHIEALRFLCCCMVLCYSYGVPGVGFESITGFRYFLERHLYASYSPLVGVLNSLYPAAIFFTISGFALSSKFVLRRDFKELHFQCHKRLLRILPCCICVVVLYEFQVRVGLLSMLARGKFYTSTSWMEAQDGYLPGMRQCGLLGPVCHGLGVSTPFWVVCFELIAPHFLLLMAHLSPPPNAGLVGQRWLAAFAFIGLPLLTPFTYPLSGLAAGYFLAEQDAIWRSLAGKYHRSQRGVIVAATVTFHALAGSLVNPFQCHHLHWCGICYQLSGSALVWLIFASPRAQWLLHSTGLHRLGYLAFPVFVGHLLVIKDMGFVREEWPAAAPFIACAEVFFLAQILYSFVEAPCAAIADTYADWMTATPKLKAPNWTDAEESSEASIPEVSKRSGDV